MSHTRHSNENFFITIALVSGHTISGPMSSMWASTTKQKRTPSREDFTGECYQIVYDLLSTRDNLVLRFQIYLMFTS